MFCNACFMRNELVANFSSLIHANLFLNVCNSPSASPIARWSIILVSLISMWFVLQKFFTWYPIRHFAWSNQLEPCVQWLFMYMSKNFVALGPFSLSNIYAEGNLEKQSIAARKHSSLLFSSYRGPSKSICISWFGSAQGIWEWNCLAGITDLSFLQIAVLGIHSVDLDVWWYISCPKYFSEGQANRLLRPLAEVLRLLYFRLCKRIQIAHEYPASMRECTGWSPWTFSGWYWR